MITALNVIAIVYTIWVLLIFAYEKLDSIINNNPKLKALDRRLMRMIQPKRERDLIGKGAGLRNQL